MGHVYSSTFYDYIERGARASAQRVASYLIPALAPQSVLDIGCGRGAWLAEWQSAGVPEVFGLDGDYVDRNTLRIDPAQFQGRDLSKPFDIGRDFDLVQSLEVAEHLPDSAARTFVENLIRHGDMILFSAAVVGQGGEDHINEQPLDYWRRLFEERDFVAYDAVRPLLAAHSDVEPWYRYNTILYVHPRAQHKLPAAWQKTIVLPKQKLREGGNLQWRLRRKIVATMPRKLVDEIAVRNAARKAAAVA